MKKPELKTHVELITPQKAREWLKLNFDNNRPLREMFIRMLVRTIHANNWVMDGNSIRFSVTGVLLDGQHRLHAISRANKAVYSNVTYGVPDEAMGAIDRGTARSVSDVLSIKGSGSGVKKKLAVARIIFRWEKGHSAATSAETLSISEAESLLEEFGDDIQQVMSLITYNIEPGIRSGGGSCLCTLRLCEMH